MGIANHESRMYKFSHFLPYSSRNVLLSHPNDTRNIWNERFENLNYRYLQALRKENMVEGLLSIKFSKDTCKGCIVGKHAKHKYGKGEARRDVLVLYLTHSDLIGPIPTLSYGKSRYVLTFIDYFSGYCWVFFLKQKFEVYEIFKYLKSYVENFIGKRIKVLRTHNGK